MDETLLSPGSVVLLAEAFPHQDNGKIGINLRTLWRVSRARSWPIILATYLSGFTAKAYLEIDAIT